MKTWLLPRNRYVALNSVFTVMILVGVMLIPAFAAKPYEYLSRITETYLNHLDFINIFVGVMVIVFMVMSIIMLLFNLMLFFRIVKPKVMGIACFVMAAVLLVLFIASVIYSASRKMDLYISGYLLWLWIILYAAFGIIIRPAE